MQKLIRHYVEKTILLKRNLCIRKGAKKFFYLNVSAAFHSKLMNTAEINMKNYLSKTNFSDSIYPVISNFSATANQNKEIIFENLSKQMSKKVKWTDSIKLIENYNEKNIIEIGPGKILTSIIKRITKRFNHYSINDLHDIELLKNS